MPLVVLALATWRISNLLVNEAGPYFLFERLRHWVGVRPLSDQVGEGRLLAFNEVAAILLCVWCTSIWVGLFWIVVYWLLPGPALWCALPFALSAVACLLDNWTEKNDG